VLRVRMEDRSDAVPVIELKRHDLAGNPLSLQAMSEGMRTATHRPAEAIDVVRAWLDDFVARR